MDLTWKILREIQMLRKFWRGHRDQVCIFSDMSRIELDNTMERKPEESAVSEEQRMVKARKN